MRVSDALIDDLSQRLPFSGQKTAIQPRLELIDRQMQRMQDKECRLVECRGRAVTVNQPGRVEAADGISQPVAHGNDLGQLVGFGHGGS